MAASLLVGQGVEKDFSDFNIAAFALDTDEAGSDVRTSNLVHAPAVDDGFHGVIHGDDLEGIPFADGILIRRAGHGRMHAFFAIAGKTAGAGSAVQPVVALFLVLALAFDAFGPDLVRQLHVDQHAGII